MVNPKSKGKRGEYFIRDLLRGFGYKAERTPLSGGLDGWKGDITSNFPFFLEVKNTAKTTFPQWYDKANDQCGNKPPAIIWVHKGEGYAFLLFSDLLQLAKTSQIIKQVIPKPQKKAKLGKEDTAWQGKFSKFAMSHRKEKKMST